MQSSGQVGAALVLAVVTALVAAGARGPATSPSSTPGVILVTGIALAGLALSLVPVLTRPRGRHA